jgi:hypothetical protein
MTEQEMIIRPKRVEDPTPMIESQMVRVDGPNEPDTLIFKRFQEIPDWFIQRLRDAEAARRPRADLRKVASIPEEVVEHWKRQGFDVHKESAQAIVTRLSAEDMGAFITGKP